MKVFISSVTHRLKEERNALHDYLRVVDHEPLRFEDFQAQNRSSREACLAGVDMADVYVLLLGPKYGDPAGHRPPANRGGVHPCPPARHPNFGFQQAG